MKKLFIVTSVLMLYVSANAQWPQEARSGSRVTLSRADGAYGSDSGYVFRGCLPDTTSANLGFLDGVAGQVIRLCSDKFYFRSHDKSKWIEFGSGSGAGTVTSFASGNLPPLFITSVVDGSTTPTQSFTLSNTGPYTVFGRASGVGTPSYLSTLDSNWIPSLHSENYYNTKYYSITNPSGYISTRDRFGFSGEDVTASAARTFEQSGFQLMIQNSATNMYWRLQPSAGRNEFYAESGSGGTFKSVATDGTPDDWFVQTVDNVWGNTYLWGVGSGGGEFIDGTGLYGFVSNPGAGAFSSTNMSAYEWRIKINLGNINIDTLLNLTAQNAVIGWTSTSGSNRGKVGYLTPGTGIDIVNGQIVNTGLTTNPTWQQTLNAGRTGDSAYIDNGVSAEQYVIRHRNNLALGFPVVTFKPTPGTARHIAFDVMPFGNPGVDFSDNGITWADFCDRDVSDGSGDVVAARVGITTTEVQFGSRHFGSATAKPVSFIIGADKKITLAINNTASFNIKQIVQSQSISGDYVGYTLLNTNNTTVGSDAISFIGNDFGSLRFGFFRWNNNAAVASGSLRPNSLQIATNDGATGGLIFGSYGTNGKFSWHTGSGVGITEKMRLDSLGQLGIGTTVPVKLLHTVGTVRHASLGTASSDTTTHKPLGIDANGDVFPMTFWPGSGTSGFTTADNGLTASSATNVQLGATASGSNSPLLHNTFINTTSSFYLEVNGSIPNSTAKGVLRAINTSTSSVLDAAFYAEMSTGSGYGIWSTSTNGRGIRGEGGIAGVFGTTTSASGVGVTATNTSTTSTSVALTATSSGGQGAVITSDNTSNNTVVSILDAVRTTNSGAGADGLGGAIEFKIETTTLSSIALSNQLISKWTTATAGSPTSQFIITGVNSGTTQNLLSLAGSGQLTLDQYTGSNFNTAQAKVAMVGTDGKVYAVDTTGLFGGDGTTYTFTNGLTEAAGTVKLGGTLSDATTTLTGGANKLAMTFNSLAGANGLEISSSSALAASNAQKLVSVALSGLNVNSGQRSYSIYSSNVHTGTLADNIAIGAEASGGATNTGVYSSVTGAATSNTAAYFTATGATDNYAIVVPDASGWVGFGVSAPVTILHVNRSDRNISDAANINSGSILGSTVSLNGTTLTGNKSIYATYNSQTVNLTANQTIPNATDVTAGFNVMVINNTNAFTLTFTAGAGGTIRALSATKSAFAVGSFNSSSVITHAANFHIEGFQAPATTGTVTNYYGLLVEDQKVNAPTWTFTNRWGIYQEGALDRNLFAGKSGFGITPTAQIHTAAHSTTANTAPIKLTSGTAMTTPEDGAFEYHASHLYFTIGSTRYQLDQQAAGGYTNLTQFVDQTAWRIFYSNGSGDVTELALGASGTYLKSNGATSAPTFETPAGSGDMVLADVQSVTGLKTFDKDKLAMKGTSTGVTTFSTANTGASNFTATFQAATGTVAYLADITGTNSGTNTGDQSLANTSDATSHTVTLTGGTSVQLIEGANITLTTGGTGGVGTVTIASTAGGGDVSKVGTPANNQLGVWTGDGTLEGPSTLTYDGTQLYNSATQTSNSGIRSNSIEIQGYGVNNAWFGDNIYYDAGFKYRADGYATQFYFYTGEGQFRMNESGTAGSSAAAQVIPLKMNVNQTVGIGGNMSATAGTFTGATLIVTSTTITANQEITVPDDAYGAGWNGSFEVPTKNALWDKIETLSGGGLVVGTSTITSGANTNILYNNSGVLGEYTITGSGTVVVMQNSPTLTTPRIASGGYIADANGNELIIFTTTASAVNELTFSNGATGVNPKWTASGETNVGIDWQVKGSGVYRFLSTSSGPAEIRLFEDTDNGTNYTSFIAPAGLGADVVLTMPTISGTITAYSESAITSNATWSPVGSSRQNYYDITAQAANITTISAPSGTPTNHNELIMRATCDATPRTITGWNAIYRFSTNLAAPTTLTASKTMYLKFIYNSTSSTWDCNAILDGFSFDWVMVLLALILAAIFTMAENKFKRSLAIIIILPGYCFAQSSGATTTGYGARKYQLFSSTSSWTCPAGVNDVIVECWGGGGTGGPAQGNPSTTGGGAGGSYAKDNSITVTQGTSYTVTVGAVATSLTTAAVNGNPSWFSTTGTVFAEGGAGSAAVTGNNGNGTGASGSTASTIGDVENAGGNGGNSTTATPISGGGGGGAGSGGAGGSTANGTAGTGTATGGGSGGAGIAVSNTRNAGVTAGGGGSGAYAGSATDRRGGDGAAGQVVVEWRTTHLGFF